MKLKNFLLIFSILMFLIFVGYFSVINSVSASKCPQKTTAGTLYITFVGKVIDLGNHPVAYVWFEYGKNKDDLNKKTKTLTVNSTGFFCIKERFLKPCTTYYYRAGIKNSVGTNYGEVKSISTNCLLNKGKSFLKLKSL